MREVTLGESGSLDATYGVQSGAVREAISNYMNGAPVVLASPEVPENNENGEGASPGFHSDGEWFWSSAGARKFEEGCIDLQIEFVEHVMARHTPPKELSSEQYEEVLRFLIESQ